MEFSLRTAPMLRYLSTTCSQLMEQLGPLRELDNRMGFTLTCRICSKPFVQPYTLRGCGHSFCAGCLNITPEQIGSGSEGDDDDARRSAYRPPSMEAADLEMVHTQQVWQLMLEACTQHEGRLLRMLAANKTRFAKACQRMDREDTGAQLLVAQPHASSPAVRRLRACLLPAV